MRKVPHLLVSSLTGGIIAFLAVGFLSNFYTSWFSFIFLSYLLSAIAQFIAYFLVEELYDIIVHGWRSKVLGFVMILMAGGLAAITIELCLRFPTLFNRRILFMDVSHVSSYITWSLVSAATIIVLIGILDRSDSLSRIRSWWVYRWIRGHLAGLLLASLFFVVYFTLAETINFPGYRTLDQFFDTDISAWLARLSAPSPLEITDVVRAVHPAVLLFLRPVIWIISLILNGNRLHAIFILHALAGASCVFLMWNILKRVSSNTSYALAGAFLLGVSASHLLLGSMLETYIYSALGLLTFVSLLQNDYLNLKSAVLVGVVVLGVTVTNFVQVIIMFIFKQPRLKVIFLYGVIVAVIVIVLNLVQAWIYPAAQPLSPANLQGEEAYQVDLMETHWRLTGRISLMARAITSYGILAPSPFILMEDLGMNVPNFRTFKITIGEYHVAGYSNFGDILVKLWILLLVIAFGLYLRSWWGKQKPVLATSLLVCLGFNFFLHVLYGDDPMLYSPDWVYALVLFVMVSLVHFSDRKWLQIPLAAFLLFETINNFILIQKILEVSAPYYGM